jgi:myo-inositol-1-phosphate synthase
MKTGNDIVHESSMLSMKRRFANVLANMSMNSSGNLEMYNLLSPLMMMTTKRSFPTMS